MSLLTFSIPLPPVPWAAPERGRYSFYDRREPDKRAVRYLLAEQYKGTPIEEYTSLFFRYSFKPPASTTKKKKLLMLKGEILPTRCDCTNLQKLYEDCLKGIVIDDDRKVAQIFSEKLYAEKDQVFIALWIGKFPPNFLDHVSAS
jgi:Holliday junction resolvase RusA-like endonuclease